MEAWVGQGGVACTRRADLHKLQRVGALEVHLEPFGGVCIDLEVLGGDLRHLEAIDAHWRCLEELLRCWRLVRSVCCSLSLPNTL